MINPYFHIMHKTVFPTGEKIPDTINIFDASDHFPCEHSGNNIVPYLFQTVIHSQLSPYFTPKPFAKFEFLQQQMENMFIQTSDKESFFKYFCKIQRRYFALLRFVSACKFKVAKIQIAEDLYMNPLQESDRNVIAILQNGKKYLFSIANMINIANTALTNAPHFFVSPLPIKNPYNNLVFSKSALYHIFFAIKSSTFILSMPLYYFFLANFDLLQFQNEYEGVIRDIAIETYVKMSDWKLLFPAVKQMLLQKSKIRVDKEFPGEKLVNIMKPYLRLFYIYKYSLDDYKRTSAVCQLRAKLARLHKACPQFGRKMLKKEYGMDGKKKYVAYFEETYTPFCETVSIHRFMKNHVDIETAIHIYANSSDESESEEENDVQRELLVEFELEGSDPESDEEEGSIVIQDESGSESETESESRSDSESD